MKPPYDGLHGFREVAGLRTEDGGRLRSGLLYRSGTPQFLDLPAARRLIEEAGIRSTVDLRLPHEVVHEGRGPLDELGIRHVPHPIKIRALVAAGSAVAPMTGDDPLVDSYLRYLSDGADEVVGVFPALLRPGMLPTLVHCTVGKDRTGVVVALLLAAVGVRREEIVAEYAAGAADVPLSMERLRTMVSYGDDVDLYPRAIWEVEPNVMNRFLDAVDERYGGVLALLADHGVPSEVVEELTELLVEHPSDLRASEELP